MRRLTPLAILGGLLLLAGGPAAADVSVHEGHIAGTITFQADFQPTSMIVEAADPTGQFSAQGPAQLFSYNNGVSVWTYDIVVEALAVNEYYVRPTAHEDIPGVSFARAPFPDFPQFGAPGVLVSPGNTTPFDITYEPAILGGVVTVDDGEAPPSPLPLRSFFLNAADTAPQAVQPDCVGSINFCKSASQIQGVISSYKLYLKPGHTYLLYSQALSVSEPALGTDAYNAISFDNGEQYVAGGAGTVDARDYHMHQAATVEGELALVGASVTSKGVGLSASTKPTATHPALDYGDQFFPASSNPADTYILRLFDIVDFSKPISLSPLFVLSADGASSVQFPKQTIAVASGDEAHVDFSGEVGTLTGKVTFFPAYKVTSIFPLMEAVTLSGGLTRNKLVPDPVNGGTYALTAYADTWAFWRWGWSFDLGDPNFDSTYNINNYLTPPAVPAATILGLGDVETNDFQFDLALVKVFFTAPISGTLSDPQLDAHTTTFAEHAHADGMNQTDVTTGEARIVLRAAGDTFVVTPKATVQGTIVTFSPFTVTPQPGETIVVGTPANIALSVTSPQPGASSVDCQFAVEGSAGGTHIATITINGTPVSFAPDPTPADPERVAFGTTVSDSTGQIVVTAMDIDGNQVSAAIPVVCLNQPPTIGCPEPVYAECGSPDGGTKTLTVEVADANLDALTVTWSVDGVAEPPHVLAAGATSDSLTHGYALGAHSVTVDVDDGNGGTASCSTTVTVQDTTAPIVTAKVSKGLLWPPDHDLIDVGLQVTDTDTCDASPETFVEVYSNENDLEETGTGNFSPDAKRSAAGALRLRSERKGNGSGRVYLIIALGSDHNGDQGSDCAVVVVPHDKSAASIAAVNQMAAAALDYCHAVGAAPPGYTLVGVGPVVGPKQ